MDSTTSRTTIDRLPIDLIRPIVRLVDTESVAQLFSSLNHKMQSLLLHPHLFNTLSMISVINLAKQGPYRYLLSALRDIDCLRLEAECIWFPQALSLLTTLNPRHLVVAEGYLPRMTLMAAEAFNTVVNCEQTKSTSFFESLLLQLPDGPDTLKAARSAEMHPMVSLIRTGGLPDLTVLTTRLETLDVRHFSQNGLFRFTDLSDWIPPIPTLKTFCGPPRLDLRALAVPSTLTSLSLCHPTKLCLKTLFTQLPLLQIFKLEDGQKFDDNDSISFILPPSLTHVELGMAVPESPSSFIDNPSLALVPLKTFVYDMSSPPRSKLKLGLLPATLTSLTLLSQIRTDLKAIIGLPSGLTRFTVDIGLLEPLEGTDFSSWLCLEHLEIRHALSPHEVAVSKLKLSPRLVELHLASIKRFDLGSLPLSPLIPKLTSLTIKTKHINPLSATEIQSLPPTLKRLALIRFDLSLAESLLAQLPNCQVSLDIGKFGMTRSSTDFLLSKFAHFWLPRMDVASLTDAICQYLHTFGPRFATDLDWLEVGFDFRPPPQPTNAPGLIMALGLPAFAAQEDLSGLLSVILPPSANAILDDMPTTLTSLTSLHRPCAFTQWPFLGLSRLVAPNTRITSAFYHYIYNMDELKATIAELDDFDVQRFLTSLSRKTRLNALLTLEVSVTGKLLPDAQPNMDWSSLAADTFAALLEVFALPMPPIDPQSPEVEAHKATEDCVGSVVEYLQLKDAADTDQLDMCALS